MAVDTLGNLLAMVVTPANEQERSQVAELAKAVREVTGEHVKLACVDQCSTGEETAEAAAESATPASARDVHGDSGSVPAHFGLSER